MMRPYGEGLKVHLYRAPVDMRKWRNGLATLAQPVMKVDPFSGAPLIFVGKLYNPAKILKQAIRRAAHAPAQDAVPRVSQRWVRRSAAARIGRGLPGGGEQRWAQRRSTGMHCRCIRSGSTGGLCCQ